MADVAWNKPVALNESRLLVARWAVLLLLAAAAACAYLTRHALAVANTTIQAELGINNEQFGYLYGAFSLGYMLFQIPGGWLGQKLGTRIALPLFAVLWSIMTVATALVTTLAALIAVRLLFGLAQAGLVPNQGKAVRDWVPGEARGSSSAVLLVAMSLGSIASVSLTGWLMTQFDWRSIFLGYACIGLAWSALFAIVFREYPRQVRWLHASSDALAADTWTTAAPPSRIESSPLPLPRMLVSRNMWALSVQALFKAAGYNLIVTFLPALLEYAYHIPRQQTGSLTAWSLATFVAGSILGGWLLDSVLRRTGSKYLSRSGVASLALMSAGALCAVAGYANTAQSMAAWLAAAGLLSGMASSTPWVAAMDISARNTAVVIGFMNSFSALAGVLISPLVGRLVDSLRASQADFSLVFWIHAGFYLIAAASWLAVNPDRSFDEPDEAARLADAS